MSALVCMMWLRDCVFRARRASPAFASVQLRRSFLRALPLIMALACAALAARAAHAELTATATSDQSTYVRGRTNTFDFRITLFSQVFENADNVHFRFPPGVTVSAMRYVDGFTNCPDALLLTLGAGTSDAGWFNAGHPSQCGFFSGFPDGAPQIYSVDADIPPGFAGDLAVEVVVEGDACCDPPPHDASIPMTFADAASPARWNFDDVAVPALPAGWSTQTANAGVGWTTVTDGPASAPNAAHAPTSARRGDASLTSPAAAIDASGGELRFRHRYATDAGHDGGVLELAIDGGAFADIVAAGGVFRTGGYAGAIGASAGCSGANANPLLGRAAFTGALDSYADVAVVLPDAAAGHLAQVRWRLGTDCNGQAIDPAGWWIDDVELVARAPAIAIGPDKIAVALDVDAQQRETIGIGNPAGGTLDFTLSTADGQGDCSSPAEVSWLRLSTDQGAIAGGTRDVVGIEFDSHGLAGGNYDALVCVGSSDGARPVIAVPVALVVTPDACLAGDLLFRDGFEEGAPAPAGATPDLCNGALRIYANRDAFLADVAPGYAEDRYTGLRSGPLFGPIVFGNGTFIYSVFTEPDPINPSLFLFPGSGVLSTRSSGDQLTLTFIGAPVTAVGGNFNGALFSLNFRPPVASAKVVVTLDDGSSETFVARPGGDFRGFIARRPIQSLSIATPEVDEVFGDFPWGVIDNLVVGSAR